MLLSNAELRDKLDVKQDAKLIQWLNDHRVRWFRDAKQRPRTTLDAINQVLLQSAAKQGRTGDQAKRIPERLGESYEEVGC